MSNPPFPPLDDRLAQAAPRARRLLGGLPATGREATAPTENAGPRRGPPDAADTAAIARRLRAAAPRDAGGAAWRDPGPEAEALAATMVERARATMEKLLAGAPDGAIGAEDALALEAVMHARGRPALRVETHGLEALDEVRHPGSDFWRPLIDDHAANLFTVAGATGAVQVRDLETSRAPWVQGSAWLAGPDRVVTNRHVLFPPSAGVPLARRVAGARTTARFKPDYQVTIDLAFDNGTRGPLTLAAVEVLYVAEEGDPVDVAVIRVAAPAGLVLPSPLTLAPERFERSRLYVVGHPGRMDPALVLEKVQAVFGTPDERKRVSLGELMDDDPARPGDLLHDASTIGGYSGGCVLGFLKREVVGLHYFGDPTGGNRAVLSTALLAHPVAQFLCGGHHGG